MNFFAHFCSAFLDFFISTQKHYWQIARYLYLFYEMYKKINFWVPNKNCLRAQILSSLGLSEVFICLAIQYYSKNVIRKLIGG